VIYIWSRCCSGVPSKPVPSRISSSLSSANSSPSFIKRHAIAAQMKSPLAWTTSCLKILSPGHSGPRVHSCPIILRRCSKKREISWLMIAGYMSWSTKSWCSACGIVRMPCRIGTSGLLVKKTLSLTVVNDRASARSCRIVRTWLSLSHSSRASMISK
jgi:hypothetical protein